MTAIDRSTTAAELLDRLINLDESEQIEAKAASAIGDSVMETVCAFANEPGLGGGVLLLGVAREDLALFPSYEVVGVTDPEKLASDLATRCRGDFNVPVPVEVRPEKVGDKVVLLAFVREAPASDKPIYFRSKGLPRGAFRRIEPTDQRCSEDDMQVFFAGRGNETPDAAAVAGTSLDDIDADALADYRRAREEANPDAEELRWNDRDLLIALNCARQHRGATVLTLAGVLLFGKSTLLRRLFPMMRVDYIRVPGREWVPDPERRFDSIELRDPLIRLIRRATNAVMDDLPKGFSLPEGQLQRQDVYPIPQRVIREAIVNAVMHRNYRVQSPIQIIRYSNRLEIINPGFSLKSPEHLGEPGSQTRNPAIAAVLHETRFAETKGSGIRVMRDMMERAGLTPPTFESDRAQDKFTARYLFHHFLGAEDLAWLGQFRHLSLTDEDARALVWVREVGAINNSTFRELNKMDTLAASRRLRHLRDVGLLQQKDKGAATYYVPTPLLLLGSSPTSEAGSPDSGVSSPNSGASSPNSEARSPDSEASSPNSPGVRPTAGAMDEVPPERDPLLLEIARPVRESRKARQTVQRVILQLCSGRFLSVRQLAALLDRRDETLRSQYLTPMLEQGLLELRYPNTRNHPDQAYRTRASAEEQA